MLRFSTVTVVAVAIIPIIAAGAPAGEADYKPVDEFSYSQQAARAAWHPMAGSKPVSVGEIDGRRALTMPCNFRGTQIDRASWDRKVKLDMTACRGMRFLLRCSKPSAIGRFTMYFRSGGGWYNCGFEASTLGKWAVVRIHKRNARIEGKPDGWGNVDTIRISAWRGGNADTEFAIAALGLFGTGGRIAVVRGDSAAGQARDARKYAGIIERFLDRLDLPYMMIADKDVRPERLKGIKLVILPYNPAMGEKVTGVLAAYMKGGGKLIACYVMPKRLQEAGGIRLGRHVREKYKGYFASINIRSSGLPLPGMPGAVKQASWNVCEASPIKGRSHVAAWWYTDKNEYTRLPAVVASNNCVYLSHVLLGDDPENKQRLLLAMAGHLVPELWDEAARGRIAQIGRFEPYDGYEAARRGISALAGADKRAGAALARAAALHKQAQSSQAKGKFVESVIAAGKARLAMIDAHCLAQKPLKGEHRAFWCHSAFGVAGMSWDQAAKRLADNGFTAILPNMLWAGSAFYKSDVLPVAPEVAEKGDQIALCLAACKKYGLACHVWKVNFRLGRGTPKGFAARMKAAGRMQVDYHGKGIALWLCPSHPDNQKLEIDSMIEVARKYPVDGLHFDYIRYPGQQGCFCDGCRKRFEKSIGRKVGKWPADVRKAGDPLGTSLRGKWLDFRRSQITTVVAAVAEQARKIRPGIKISAAVFRNWPTDRDSIGQDWKLWCDRGYLDFVCPMDYTPNSGAFERMVRQQLTWTGRVPCYPGIGLSTWSNPTDVCKAIVQINAARRLGAKGFTIFNYGPAQAADVVPMLGKGITRKQ